MDVKWVKIRSWHAVESVYPGTAMVTTRCGRRTIATPVDDLPGGRSCESCLRILARKADA